MRTEYYKDGKEIYLGFKTIEDAREYAEEIGGNVYLFQKKIGQDAWSYYSLHDSPISVANFYENESYYYFHYAMGDSKIEEAEYYASVVLQDLNEACATIEEAMDMLEYHKKVVEYRQKCDVDEFVLEELNSQTFKILPQFAMEYFHGATYYAVGVRNFNL